MIKTACELDTIIHRNLGIILGKNYCKNYSIVPAQDWINQFVRDLNTVDSISWETVFLKDKHKSRVR